MNFMFIWTAEWRTNAKKIITVKETSYAVFVKLESQKNSGLLLNMTQITSTCNSVVLGKIPTKLPVWSHKGSQLPHDHC